MNPRWVLLMLFTVAGCGSSAAPGDMGQTGCTPIDGICLFPPAAAAARTACGDVVEFCDKSATAAPNLACLATPKVGGAGPATVTLTGFIDVFSAGPDSRGVSIAVYEAAPLLAGTDIGAATPLASIANVQLETATQRGCDKDAKFGCSVPSTTGCTLPLCNDGLNGRNDDNKYCRSDGATATCAERLRWEARYSLPNVPTNKQLVIRTTGQNFVPDQTWAVLVSWNVFLSTSDRACANSEDYDCLDMTVPGSPKYQLNVNTLSKTDYVNIPTTAGLSGGIPTGQGAVAGEIHDCDNIRVEHVTVGVTPTAARNAYFNGNPLKTLPDSSRSATDRLGLYAALALPPGKVHAVAAGNVNGQFVTFGSFDAYVYADSVSVVNINGGKPRP